jgi:phosphomethylpyrimidine synthase
LTQLETARNGSISLEMRLVADGEGVDPELVREGVANGTIVIPANANHRIEKHCGIGRGLRVKVNANIGTSSDHGDTASELEKLRVAVEFGADTVMDLSTGGDISAIRRAIIKESAVPIGTVPIYQAGIEAIAQRGAVVNMTDDDMFRAIEEHAADGVDFVTVHCGVTRASIGWLQRHGRLTDIVSRGGAFLLGWILHNDQENPLYEQFDRLLDIARRYDVTLSLGDGLRPGSIVDATDSAQVEELLILGELVETARDAGVQVIVEGPGHIPLDEVVANVQLQKSVCYDAPFYVLGPLVTDVAAGYDHISGAIGGAVAAMAGADFLCYVTPSEHLALPGPEEVKEGVIASRIAAHAADITRCTNGAWDWDRRMSAARKNLDWAEQLKLCMDPEKAKRVHEGHEVSSDACSMCGDLCAMKLASDFLRSTSVECQL